MKVAVAAETGAGEPRVAAVPETVKKMIGLGAEVAVEPEQPTVGAIVTPPSAMTSITGTLLNVRLDGVKVTCGEVPGVPVPVSATVCGLCVTLSAILTLAVRAPVAPGLKVTEMVQLAPAATLDPQVLVSA